MEPAHTKLARPLKSSKQRCYSDRRLSSETKKCSPVVTHWTEAGLIRSADVIRQNAGALLVIYGGTSLRCLGRFARLGGDTSDDITVEYFGTSTVPACSSEQHRPHSGDPLIYYYSAHCHSGSSGLTHLCPKGTYRHQK